MPPIRQLAAIMFADIEGYTALMQENEERANRLREKFQKKLEQEILDHNGRIWELKGDGAMCSFPSTIEGVRAALSLQMHMQEEPSVPLRIGMHTGDVIFEEKTMYGDGVNLASRMESFALAGSILISGKVYDDIKNHKDVVTVSLGKYILKNVTEEIDFYAISNEGILVPDYRYMQGKGRRVDRNNLSQKCVVVLPFVNMSNDPEQEYFSDGLTEEIITNLSRLKDMRVASRTTSMQYKNTTKDLKTIGKEVGVNYVMEGSVRKAGRDLRITAQFIDAINDIHLWAETYRGTIDDIFDIQEKVSAKIVEELSVQLTKDEQKLLQKHYTDNTEAYQLYLQGRSYWKKRNEESLKTAVTYFEKALEKDPDYALAWTGLADTYSLIGEYTNISRRDVFPKQMAAVQRALELDIRLGEAHISLAISLMLNEWDWKNALKEYRMGIELSPNYATGHHWYAECLLFLGRFEESFNEISLAVDLDPVSPGILKDKGINYYYTGHYNQAINIGLMTLEIDPQFIPAHRLLSMSYAAMGQFDEAIEQNRLWGEQTGNRIKTNVALAQLYAESGRKEEAQNIMRQIEEGDMLTQNDNRGMALAYASLDEKDLAFEWLQKSYDKHEESLCSLKIDPKLKSLHTDPRFDALLKKIGLVE